MPVTRADELDARPADTAKELLALADKLDAWSPVKGPIAMIARERRMCADALRLSARQQASAEKLADWMYDNGFCVVSDDEEDGLARDLLAKYDIFEKVEG